ncbi:MAG: hypothetical protein MJ147_06050 [Clostridia bacterium]|nr:hypothetical protein [Clostridia bacterium]
MKCEKCEKEFVVVEYNDRKVHEETAFCPHCGHEKPKPEPPPAPKQHIGMGMIFALVLVVFLLYCYSLMNNA